MATRNYSKREQDLMQSALAEKIDDFRRDLATRMSTFENATTASLQEIMKKQEYTNGKVAFVYKWYWVVFGFCCCLSIIVLPLIWALVATGKL